MQKDYGIDFQKTFLEMMLDDAQLYVRVLNIYNSANFDKSIRPAAEFIKDYWDKYNTLPAHSQISVETGIKINPLDPALQGSQHNNWFLEEFECFTKKEELSRAILKSYDLLEKGEFNPVEKLIKDAVQISLTKDLGTDYFSNINKRVPAQFDNGYKISTGWPRLDHILYGGFGRGELNIFAGGSGSGKSLVMMNIAINWLQSGLNGVYISLELSEGLVGLRTDAMICNMSTKEIRANIDTAVMKLNAVKKNFGQYRIKALPAQSNVNDIRAYIREMEVQTGVKVDFVMVDYLDLLMPVSAKVSPNDLFVKDKYVSEELRNLADELNVLFVTASQLNRSAVDEVEFDHSHISGGISKINTADNVFGIFTSRAMKERGKYQIQCMKSRSSTGVGQKIDLEYNIETMRITDEGGDDNENGFSKKPSTSIMDSIKAKSQVSAAAADDSKSVPWERPQAREGFDLETPKVTADVQSAKLKQLLGKIKTS